MNSVMRIKRILTICFVCVSFMGTVTAQPGIGKQQAFPGAEGFGRYTVGGRGGEVICVTNLNDSGEGSLRAALQKKCPRIIVFKVSGIIYLKRSLDMNQGDVTVAGQTAPADGITIAGYPVKVKADNVILRYLRFRMGDINKAEGDALDGIGRKNIMIDHCSVSWSTDECATFYGNENFTMQWCLISESLKKSVHLKGEHGYGGIWGGKGASFHHNLLAHHDSRNPRFCHPGITDVAGVIDFRNNVIYNWGGNSSYGGDTRTINLVNNYYKPGPATLKNKSRIFQPYLPCGKYYISGNYVAESEKVTLDNWLGVKPKGDVNLDTVRLSEPLPIEHVNTQSAEQAYKLVLGQCGASLVRDKIDLRVVDEVARGTATYGVNGIIDSQSQVGGFPKVIERTSWEPDSDADGMPDIWEVENGLNPGDVSDTSLYTLSKEYTNIEVYINSLIK